ncbi:MAG: VWA domain-containing protein [Candidatus Dormiibacterota bacterium]
MAVHAGGLKPRSELPAPLSFSGVVGQDRMKLALLLAVVEPNIGGVLIRGERGTAKSTLVRALAAILPTQEQVADCPYHCAPSGPDQCQDCVARVGQGEVLPSVVRPTRVVELPLGASEDRIVGSIDMELALSQGRRAFQPGLLAEANRQILYVDEVNLLDHHLVDVLLDAAAGGVNVVEREEISISHPSRFVLVGTMNPEEGDLRPQLLDRFGLCVEVAGLMALEDRVEVMQRDATSASLVGEDRLLADRLLRAKGLLSQIVTPELVVRVAAAMSVDQQAIGHRSDLVLVRAAQADRALEAAEQPTLDPDDLVVSLRDLTEVAELALVHRRRSLGSGLQEAPSGITEAPAQMTQTPSETAVLDSSPQTSPTGAETTDEEDAEGPGSPQSEGEAAGDTRSSAEARPGPVATDPIEVDEGFAVGRIELPRERLRRRGSGRRSQTSSRDRRGRYVGAREVEHPTDLALDATLRAAAPHQVARRSHSKTSDRTLQLEPQDLRQKVRERRIGNLIVFVVDASASMDAEQRMDATRSAILALLKDAYVRRDRVALISFSGRKAQVVLRPTASVDLAERHLTRIAVGGTTPLTHGLVAALSLIMGERRRDPDVLPLLVLISDGRGNISFGGEEPLVEAQRIADQIRRDDIRALVIDSSRDHLQEPRMTPGQERSGSPRFAGYNFNACVDLAERMGAAYFGLFDLSEGAILRPVAEALRQQG